MKKRFLLYFCLSLLVGGVCLIQSKASASDAFINDETQEGKESLHGVLQKTQLEPPLRDDISHIRFSPDGKYVLAQDDTGINVLTRQPFALLFRIEATNVSRAQFTPDSQSIAFYNRDLRVRLWNVGEQKLTSEHVVAVGTRCQQIELSPDAKTLACFADEGDVILFDVATNAELFRQKEFYKDPYEGMFVSDVASFLRNYDLDRRINMEFSTDGRYFAAGGKVVTTRELMDVSGTVHDVKSGGFPNEYNADPNNINNTSPKYDAKDPSGNSSTVLKATAFDLTARKKVQIAKSLTSLLSGSFTFISPDRVIGTDTAGKSELVAFPDGTLIRPLTIEMTHVEPPGRGDYVLVRPMGKYPVGIVDLKSGSVLMANKKSAIDLFDSIYVSERADGELGLYEVGKNELRAKVQLPRGALDNLQAVALSPDFKWLAVSGNSRGAVWDLSKGERVFHLRSFDGAYYADDGVFYVDFPKHESVERMIGMLQTERREVLQGQSIENLEAARLEQYGQFFTVMRRLNADTKLKRSVTIKVPISSVGREQVQVNKSASLEVLDVRTMKQLWLKSFAKQTPRLWVDPPNETMVLKWNVTDEIAKAEIKSDSRLSKQLRSMKEKDFNYLFQILNASTGQQRGSILFNTEQFSLFVGYVVATNDSVIAVTSQGRILVYSLPSGEKRTEIAGTYATVARDANLLCVKNKKSQLTIYDLATLKERDQFTFSSPVAMTRFSGDGKRLFVLTQNQTAYVLDVSSSGTSQKS